MTPGIVSAIIITVPAIYVMFHFALAPMIGVVVFIIAMLFTLFIYYSQLLNKKSSRLITIATLSVFAILMIAGSLTSEFSHEKPRPNAVAYIMRLDIKMNHPFQASIMNGPMILP